MPKHRKKAAAAKSAKKEPRRLELLGRRIGIGDEVSLHWRNKEGVLVPLRELGQYAIIEIYKQLWSAPEASFPAPTARECWLRTVREYAAHRHIELPVLEAKDDGREFVREVENG
jgi:hypothetical protein